MNHDDLTPAPIVQMPSAMITPAPKSYLEAEQARAIAEIQGALVSAQVCRRDLVYTEKMIENDCQSYEFAETVEYKLPVGGKVHQGASIRAMEMIAGYYGNIRSGYEEIRYGQDEHGSFTDCRAIAWDLKTNNHQSISFRVYHYILVGAGRNDKQKKEIKDPFEVNRLIRNHAARAQREVLKKVIPRYLVQKAINMARATLASKTAQGKSLPERIKEMLKVFASLGVKQEQIEKKIGTTYENFTGEHFADLIAIYRSIKEEGEDPRKFFEYDEPVKTVKADLDSLLKDKNT